ncbi:conserved unknown protein [Ectocarpus siliculosus]|uniref:Dienelactone hydrolase domain-containing protein n=1 Tax=Ectocarpus siliculosus TaxID=2880 RepID=D8LPY2_ECTSI|nr:conserved unknown protein [Ectocarpus siliculosus]|eukprot:CBN74874.1 conserved unknown protein [Ectocarpus siliculosus]
MAGVGSGRPCEVEEISLGATRGILAKPKPVVAASPSLQAPQDLSSCAVVLLPDVFGFDTPETTGAARLLAQQGYNTLVPDIYRGQAWPKGVEQSRRALTEWCSSQDRERMLADVKESVVFFRQREVTRLAVVGFCLGADVLLECAAIDGLFDAGVAFYPTAPSAGARTRIPTLLVFGGNDDASPPETAIKEAHAQLLGWIGTHVHANSGSWEVGRLSRSVLTESDWWPEGKGRSFRPAARETWDRARETWRIQRRPRHGLAATRRTFELPGRMTLPEIIEVFTDIWEVEIVFFF